MEMHPTLNLVDQLGGALKKLERWQKLHMFFLYGSLFSGATAVIDILITILFNVILIEYSGFVELTISLLSLFGSIFARKMIERNEASFHKIMRQIKTELGNILKG